MFNLSSLRLLQCYSYNPPQTFFIKKFGYASFSKQSPLNHRKGFILVYSHLIHLSFNWSLIFGEFKTSKSVKTHVYTYKYLTGMKANQYLFDFLAVRLVTMSKLLNCEPACYLFAHRPKLCINLIILCRELKQDKHKTLFGFSSSVFTIIVLLWSIRISTTSVISSVLSYENI